MANDHWPLLDLQVQTPRLSLRYIDDSLTSELLGVAKRGIHDPTVMPFLVPWTDVPSPQMEQEAVRFYARTRSDIQPNAWNLQFAVIVEGHVIGSCDLGAKHFSTLRQFQTGSWLGREFQGHGFGKEMRMACLTLGFDGLGAAFAETAAWNDNEASIGVTLSLGYEEAGRRRELRRDKPDVLIDYQMPRAHWETIRRNDIVVTGIDAAREFLAV